MRQYNKRGGRPGLSVDFMAVCDAVARTRNGSGETIPMSKSVLGYRWDQSHPLVPSRLWRHSMSKRLPIGELTKTRETKRTGAKGRPKAIYRDAGGNPYSKPVRRRNQHWAQCMNRLRGPRTTWPTEDELEQPQPRDAARLVQRWVVTKCNECGGVKYAVPQFGIEIFRKRSDGTWYVRTFHLKHDAVHHPLRAIFLRRPIISCKCLGKGGRPRPSQVAQLERSLKKAAQPPKEPIRGNYSQWRRDANPTPRI